MTPWTARIQKARQTDIQPIAIIMSSFIVSVPCVLRLDLRLVALDSFEHDTTPWYARLVAQFNLLY